MNRFYYYVWGRANHDYILFMLIHYDDCQRWTSKLKILHTWNEMLNVKWPFHWRINRCWQKAFSCSHFTIRIHIHLNLKSHTSQITLFLGRRHFVNPEFHSFENIVCISRAVKYEAVKRRGTEYVWMHKIDVHDKSSQTFCFHTQLDSAFLLTVTLNIWPQK